jgi:hypothetical protein
MHDVSSSIINIEVLDDAQLHIYGYGFNYSFYKMGGTPYYNGLIQGYWSDGASFRLQIRKTPEPFPQNNIILHTIPEPCSVAFFMSAMIFTRFKRKKFISKNHLT